MSPENTINVEMQNVTRKRLEGAALPSHSPGSMGQTLTCTFAAWTRAASQEAEPGGSVGGALSSPSDVQGPDLGRGLRSEVPETGGPHEPCRDCHSQRSYFYAINACGKVRGTWEARGTLRPQSRARRKELFAPMRLRPPQPGEGHRGGAPQEEQAGLPHLAKCQGSGGGPSPHIAGPLVLPGDEAGRWGRGLERHSEARRLAATGGMGSLGPSALPSAPTQGSFWPLSVSGDGGPAPHTGC